MERVTKQRREPVLGPNVEHRKFIWSTGDQLGFGKAQFEKEKRRGNKKTKVRWQFRYSRINIFGQGSRGKKKQR